jgi:hypothetical protein
MQAHAEFGLQFHPGRRETRDHETPNRPVILRQTPVLVT